MINQEKQIKSKKRVSDHGEVFTPKHIVNEMLDLVKQETQRIDSRFLEPACGTGNFLVEVLHRKLEIVNQKYNKNQIEYEKYAIIAISSIYGIDLLQDNVEETRIRLFDIFNSEYTKKYKNSYKNECKNSVKFILDRNILRGDALTLLSDNNEPIIFSEWSAVNRNMIKRRDFTLDNLLYSETSKAKGGLFDDFHDSDSFFLPTPVKEFPLIHFLRLGENE
jgi:tRNA G10  N-methylase Trm11